MKGDHLRYIFIPEIICRQGNKNINNCKSLKKKKSNKCCFIKRQSDKHTSNSGFFQGSSLQTNLFANKTMLVLLGVL